MSGLSTSLLARFKKQTRAGNPASRSKYRCTDCPPDAPLIPKDELELHTYVVHMLLPDAEKNEAELRHAADEIMGMPNVCPECKTGKHQNCDGRGGYDENDELVACVCDEGEHPHRTFP